VNAANVPCRQKLYDWIWNHFTKLHIVHNSAPLVLQRPRKKAHISLTQAYSRKYFASRIKAKVDASWAAQEATLKLNGIKACEISKQRLSHRNQLTHSLFSMEDDNIVASVKAFQQAENDKIDATNRENHATFDIDLDHTFDFGFGSVDAADSVPGDNEAASKAKEDGRVAQLSARQR
jgi:hypothetical protein